MLSSEPSSAIDEPRALAASLIDSLNSNSDILSILKLRELLDHGHELRNTVLTDLNKSCKDLSSGLSQAVNTLDVATRSLEQQKYYIELKELTTEEADLTDSLATTKESIETSNMEIERTLKELNAIEKQARLDMEAPPDAQVVKLSIYRSLGIDLLEKDGDFYGAQIRSKDKNDIHTMEFKERFESADMLWRLCL